MDRPLDERNLVEAVKRVSEEIYIQSCTHSTLQRSPESRRYHEEHQQMVHIFLRNISVLETLH